MPDLTPEQQGLARLEGLQAEADRLLSWATHETMHAEIQRVTSRFPEVLFALEKGADGQSSLLTADYLLGIFEARLKQLGQYLKARGAGTHFSGGL